MTDTIETPTETTPAPMPEPMPQAAPVAAPPREHSNVLLVTAATVVGVMLVAGISFGAGMHVGRASAAFGPRPQGVASMQDFRGPGQMRGQGGPMGGQRPMMRGGDAGQQPQPPQSQQVPQQDPAQ